MSNHELRTPNYDRKEFGVWSDLGSPYLVP